MNKYNKETPGILTTLEEIVYSNPGTPINIHRGSEYKDVTENMPSKVTEYEVEKKIQGSSFTQYVRSGNIYIPTYNTHKRLPTGVYNCNINNQGQCTYTVANISTDDLISFQDGIQKQITDEILNFWSKEETFKKWGFLHKRGYMFYGPAGSGKTCLVNQIINNIHKQEGIVFMCNHSPAVFITCLTMFRDIEPDRPIVCIFEDVDAIIENYGESELLSIFDGESQINKVVNIATTNYPEKLDRRLVSRPRRFDRVIKIDMPGEEMRRQFFITKNINKDELDLWVTSTDKFSFAAMSELIISVKCLDIEFNRAVKLIKDMLSAKNLPTSSEYDQDKKVGFDQLING